MQTFRKRDYVASVIACAEALALLKPLAQNDESKNTTDKSKKDTPETQTDGNENVVSSQSEQQSEGQHNESRIGFLSGKLGKTFVSKNDQVLF